MMFRLIVLRRGVLGVCALVALAQQPSQPVNPDEQASLSEALGEAGNSQIDFLHVLEAHLAKYPNTTRRNELERAIVKSAIELKDSPRIIRYGEKLLLTQPDDLVLLEQVSVALMATGEKTNIQRALKYAEHFLEVVRADQTGRDATGREAVRRKEQHDRAEARGNVLIARANGLLGRTALAVELAEKSYQTFASVEGAREAARWLEQDGKTEQAIRYLASAFSIAGLQAANPDIKADRDKMADLYHKLNNNSDAGLGDLILKSYDRTYAELAARRDEQRRFDPNADLKDPMQFTISGLDGHKMPLASLRGKVIVMDFWATWCGPCRAQHPLYEEVKKRFKDRDDVVFVAIDTDEDHDLVKPFLEGNKWSLNVFFEDGLGQILKVSSIPTTIVMDKKGTVYSRLAGFIPERFVDMLTDRIREALGEKSGMQASNK